MKTNEPTLRKPVPWQIAKAILPSGVTVPSFQLLACEDLKQIQALFGYEFPDEDSLVSLSCAYGMAAIQSDFAILKMLSGKL